MNKLDYMIQYLLKENPIVNSIPENEQDKKNLWRTLCNVREPKSISNEFLRIEDEFLQEELKIKNITNVDDIKANNKIALWQGDITKLKIDSIVNAANSQGLGCFRPLHNCIDNQIQMKIQKYMKMNQNNEKRRVIINTGMRTDIPAFYSDEQQKQIAKEFARIGKENNMIIHGCCENPNLKEVGIDITGCMSQEIVEKAIGFNLKAPSGQSKRIVTDGNKEITKDITLSDKGKPICNCLMGNDIGAYNSCMHLCKYCYANFNKTLVQENYKLHNPKSLFLIGESTPEDKVTQAKQKSWRIQNKLEQVSLF